MDSTKADAPAGEGLTEAKPKKKRRPHTPAVVRAPRTRVISRDEFELIVSTIAMIADRSDTENGGLTGDGTHITNPA